ncbi:MAG: DUF547 domain-containing protein [Bryobacteraceae bacterium]
MTIALLAAGMLQAGGFDHSGWDALVKRWVNQIGEVDYGGLAKDRTGLDAYVQRLEQVSPDNNKADFPSRAHELAYWINAYNALVMKGVVSAYPIKSVRDVGGGLTFFRRRDYVLGGVRMSLQHLENEIIRKRYKEPRIHFAIVCASISCPRLAAEAYTGEKLEAQLERAARQSLREQRMLAVDEKANLVSLTSLLNWYKLDFGDVMAFLRSRASESERKKLEALKNPKIRYYDYDWSINDPGSRARAKALHERALVTEALR